MSEMAAPWTTPAFSVGATTYTWDDVAAFSRRSGEWDELVREASEGLACERAGHTAPADAVTQAAKAFRYDRRLITAEETEAWLQARGIDVAQWMGWVRRTVLREQFAEQPHDADAPPDDLIWVTGRCGGRLDAAALALARRVAAHMARHGETPPADADVDSAIDRLRAEVVTDEAVAAEVARKQLDWVRVEFDEARFASEGAAREAALSVRSDGMPLAEACTTAGAVLDRRTVLIEELDDTVSTAVLGARPGDLLGPFGLLLVRIESKEMPSVDDVDIRRRAADALLAAALRREVAQRVRWA